MKKVCWIDTETTGLHPYKNDILHLAMIIEIDKKEVDKKEFFMQPFNYDTIQAEALAVNGLTIDIIKTFPQPKQVFGEIQAFLGKYVKKFDKTDKFQPAGFNVHFDVDFLKNYWKKCGDDYFGSWFNYKFIDPLQLLFTLDGRGILDLPMYKLEHVCKHFGIPHKAHNAMGDIMATKCLAEFIGNCVQVDVDLLGAGYEQFRKGRG